MSKARLKGLVGGVCSFDFSGECDHQFKWSLSGVWFLTI